MLLGTTKHAHVIITAESCSMRNFARGEDGKTRMWCIFDEGDTNYSCMQNGGRRRWASLTRHRGRSVWTVDGWAPPIEKQGESEVKRGAPHKSRRVRPNPTNSTDETKCVTSGARSSMCSHNSTSSIWSGSGLGSGLASSARLDNGYGPFYTYFFVNAHLG